MCRALGGKGVAPQSVYWLKLSIKPDNVVPSQPHINLHDHVTHGSDDGDHSWKIAGQQYNTAGQTTAR